MANYTQGPNNIECESNNTGAKDLVRTAITVTVVSSEDDMANMPCETIILSKSATVTCNDTFEETQNQMDNGQKNCSSVMEAENLHNEKEGMQLNQTNNNNSVESKSFRKSYSAVTLMLPTVFDDSCSACDQESDGYENMNSAQLRRELKKLQKELKRKEEECVNLTHVQLQTGQEVEELTASLFEEANKMVQDAHIKRMATEKSLAEANNRIEVLQAEVTALKALVLTSTPSEPNPHLNPQIDKTKKVEVKGHRRSTSHHSFVREIQLPKFNLQIEVPKPQKLCQTEESEPAQLKDFRLWRQSPSLDASSAFLSPVIREDILPCLNFANVELSKMVYEGIFSNTVSVEPLSSQKVGDSQRCALSNIDTVCAYYCKLGDLQTPFAISKMVRNRIIAVCDFVTYVRYIMQGLVKSNEKEVFAEVMRLRKKMCLARLGLEE